MQPETSYARLGEDRVACQVLGDGPPDLVLTMGAFGHVDVQWEDPATALFLRRLVKTTGDGILATFDGRGRAIGCATALREQLQEVGVRLRAGEVELRGGDVGGIAVHIAARALAAAGAGEVVVSRTLRDLVVGSEVALEDRGSRRPKGVEGDWELYAVTG